MLLCFFDNIFSKKFLNILKLSQISEWKRPHKNFNFFRGIFRTLKFIIYSVFEVLSSNRTVIISKTMIYLITASVKGGNDVGCG